MYQFEYTITEDDYFEFLKQHYLSSMRPVKKTKPSSKAEAFLGSKAEALICRLLVPVTFAIMLFIQYLDAAGEHNTYFFVAIPIYAALSIVWWFFYVRGSYPYCQSHLTAC